MAQGYKANKGLPMHFVQMGETCSIRKTTYIVREREITFPAKDCCNGCDLYDKDVDQCSAPTYQCSRFDRRDGRNVKFIKVR